jgi:hypothetical protein
VRAPLAAFVERLAGKPRHCVVVTRVNALEGTPDTLQALSWGASLARGLEYLHDNGVAFAGQIEPGYIGWQKGIPCGRISPTVCIIRMVTFSTVNLTHCIGPVGLPMADR